MTAIKSLRERFEKIDPAKRRLLMMLASGGGLMLLITVIVLITDDPAARRAQRAKPETKEYGNVLMSTPARDMGLSGLSNELRMLRESQASMERTILDLQAKQSKPGAPIIPSSAPDAALEALQQEVSGERQAMGPPGTVLNPASPGNQSSSTDYPSRGTGTQRPAEPPPPVAPTIHSTPRAEVTESVVAKALRAVYLPTGSIMSGQLLNGLDAPTGRTAQSAPIPVVIRVKHDAILPSRFKSDVREAFVLASGFGDLSSERAYLRAERFSMILNNGDIIDIPIKMSAVGDDGKSGVRGRVVSKQGAIIGKALMAGMADGVSRAFGNRGSFSGGGNELPSESQMITSGLGGGASSALDRVAAYFLSQAEAMYPVIEIDGGREVSFLLLEGTELAPRVVEEAPKVAAASTR